MNEPHEPGYSCPHLDSAISEIENARKIHDDLRKWGAWWKDYCDDLKSDHARELSEKDDEIGILNEKIDELWEQIKQLESLSLPNAL